MQTYVNIFPSSVFWMSMEVIPRAILSKIRQLMFAFLWSGQRAKVRLHLCRWDLLARSKHSGGWGLRNLVYFNSALIANTYWRALNVDSIWNRLLQGKYLGNTPFIDWIQLPTHL